MSRGFTEDKPYISTLEAAKALGVSVSTVKRWVDSEILPAHRTAGGHRKLMRSEVLALARQGDLPREDLARLVVPIKSAGVDLRTVSATLHRSLLEGDIASTRAVVQRSYEAGIALETLADEVIAPVMSKVGHSWETSQIDVWHEHRGTQLCTAALFELQADLERRAESNRPLAIGGAPSGDFYVLPSLLAQLVLIDAGWEAINLGPNTPLESLTKAIRALRPKLVWLERFAPHRRQRLHRRLQSVLSRSGSAGSRRRRRRSRIDRTRAFGTAVLVLRRSAVAPGRLCEDAASPAQAAGAGATAEAVKRESPPAGAGGLRSFRDRATRRTTSPASGTALEREPVPSPAC